MAATLNDVIWNRKQNPNWAGTIAAGGDTPYGYDDDGSDYYANATFDDDMQKFRDGLSPGGSSDDTSDGSSDDTSDGSSNGLLKGVPLSETTQGRDQGQNPNAPGTSEGASASIQNDDADADTPRANGPSLSTQGVAATTPTASTASAAPTTTAPAPAVLTPSRTAQQAYQDQLNQMPQVKQPKWWQRVAAGALGGAAGWSNASGTRAAQIDPSNAVQGILYPGYARDMANWQNRNAQLQKAAELEDKANRETAALARDAARQKAYEAMDTRAQAMYEREKNKKPPLSKAEQDIAVRDAGVKWRRGIAHDMNWTLQNKPGVENWVVTGEGLEPKENAALLELQKKYPGHTRDEIVQFEDKKRDLDTQYKQSQIAHEKYESQPHPKVGGGGGGGVKPISPAQRRIGLHQAASDKQKAYKDEEADYQRQLKEAGYIPGTTQPPEELRAEHERRQQEIENVFAQNVTNATGQLQGVWNYKKGRQELPPQDGDAEGTDSAVETAPLPQQQQQQRKAPPFNQSKFPGMLEPGNIDLDHRPVVHNPDGTISTVLTMTVEFDGKTYIIPQIVNGRKLSEGDAIKHFQKTHEHMGVFDSEDAAERFDQALHTAKGWNGAPGSAQDKWQHSQTPQQAPPPANWVGQRMAAAAAPQPTAPPPRATAPPQQQAAPPAQSAQPKIASSDHVHQFTNEYNRSHPNAPITYSQAVQKFQKSGWTVK